MSTNPALSLATTKNAFLPSQTPSPPQSQNSSSVAIDSHTQRRAGNSGGFGAGNTSRSAFSAARNNQSLRKQHKGQRRPRLADEDAAAESAAMQSTSSRKGRTSITHLMNFTLPPRPQYYQQHHFGRNARKNPTWGLGSGYHAADKAKYIHANYRFIVNPKGDYHAQGVDADVHLDWSNVLQILVSAQSQSTNCPICLSTPVAPRMAKCGHMFCLPCLIRYMHSADDTNPTPEKKARCKNARSAGTAYTSQRRGQSGGLPGKRESGRKKGGDVVLRLIMRQPGSTLALPRDGAQGLGKAEEIPWYFAAEVMDYARVMKGSGEYMMEQYENEIAELQQQEKEDELMFGEETQWTKKAVSSILEAKERAKDLESPPSAPQQPSERKTRRPPLEFREPSEDVPHLYLIRRAAKSGQSMSRNLMHPQVSRLESPPDKSRGASSSSIESSSQATTPMESRDFPASQSESPTSRAEHVGTSYSRGRFSAGSHHSYCDSPFFFYEALLHYYLSPLDIRILKAAFGDYSSFPTTILPRVERVSTGHIVDDELRRRAKYLAHLPHGCEVGFLECDWTDVVPPEVLRGFENEIERRRKKNLEKEVREEKERVRAEKEEDDKRWTAARRRRPTPSQDVITDADFQPLPEASASDFVTASCSPPWSSSRAQDGSAFASLASPSTSPVASKTVWGTRKIPPTSPAMPAILDEYEQSENDGWLQGWERDLLQEEDLVAHIEATTLGASSSKQSITSADSKKKKGKKITLMSTNARRGA